MEPERLFNEIVDLAERLGIEVRQLALGGQGGGYCLIKGKPVLFIDIEEGTLEKLHRAAQGLARFETIHSLYIIPELRELIDQYRS